MLNHTKPIDRTDDNSNENLMEKSERLSASSASGMVLDEVTICYEEVEAVKNISLTVNPGEFLALLGPSGSGKTSLLMAIAGLTPVISGDVRVGSKSILDLAPEQRGLGVVFQGYALFPHMTVEANIAFPLEMIGIPWQDAQRRVGQSLEIVGLVGLEHRYPSELSGGQQQRVALARALVFDPPVLLLDEPLGSLDKQLRASMQREFRTLHKEVGTTIIYVTHDQQEALAMADRIAVMKDGRIAQLGTPEDIFHNPKSRFVAEFIGDCNFIDITRIAKEGSVYSVEVSTYKGQVPSVRVVEENHQSTLAIRPHHVYFVAPNQEYGLPGTVTDIIFLGEMTEYIVRIADDRTMRVRDTTGSAMHLCVGDRTHLCWDWNHASVL